MLLGGAPSVGRTLAVDLRFPNPKPLRREFLELIWRGEEEGGEEGKGE